MGHLSITGQDSWADLSCCDGVESSQAGKQKAARKRVVQRDRSAVCGNCSQARGLGKDESSEQGFAHPLWLLAIQLHPSQPGGPKKRMHSLRNASAVLTGAGLVPSLSSHIHYKTLEM